MILQALNRYYDILLDDPETDIAQFGYSTVNISFALNISDQGELLDVLPLFSQVQRGKKLVEVPRAMIVPAQIKRASNVAPNFLWDNSTYVLGISDKDDTKPEYSSERHAAFRQLHQSLLSSVDCAPAQAMLMFLENLSPDSVRQHPVISANLDALMKGVNLVFQFGGRFIHEEPAIRAVWEEHQGEQDSVQMQCLVNGTKLPVARLHPSLKRVRNAQSSGASLVGFNAAAYESYNRSQGMNAPVSEKATFAYTTTLNYLLSDANPNRKFFLGDATVVYWAESENRGPEAAFASIFDPEYVEADTSGKAQGTLKTVAEKVRKRQAIDLDALLADLGDENPRFYVLGLAPNAARVSVRFFITEPFLDIVQNIMAHYRDLEMAKQYDNQPTYLSIRAILDETVSKKSSDKNASPLLAGAVSRSILTNAPYPAALYSAIINRIQKINYARAAIVKAYLIRKYRLQPQNPFKEILTMALNEQSTNPAYLLGRLFAVLEKVQGEAIGDVNASIKDRYFTSACAAPRTVFPTLLRLSQHHIAKAEYGRSSDRKIQDILNLLDVENNPIPSRLTLDEQGVFILGYYHQRAAFFSKQQDQASDLNQPESR